MNSVRHPVGSERWRIVQFMAPRATMLMPFVSQPAMLENGLSEPALSLF